MGGLLFSFSGRLSRLSYFLLSLVTAALASAAGAVVMIGIFAHGARVPTSTPSYHRSWPLRRHAKSWGALPYFGSISATSRTAPDKTLLITPSTT